MKRRVLITGAWGYVGARLVDHLVREAPDLSLRLFSRKTPLQPPEWAGNSELVCGDVTDASAVTAAVRGVNAVVHLAAVNEIVSEAQPDHALKVNAAGTLSVLRAAQEQRVPRFVYLSTFHVYGTNGVGDVTEQTLPRPVHPYAITHRTAEDFVDSYQQRCGMQTVILRLSNGYGYPMHPGVDRWTLVVNDLCRQAVQQRKLLLKTPGLQLRDFITLEDVARALNHAIHLPETSRRDGLFNLGGDCTMSILQMAQRVAEVAGQRYDTRIPIERPDPSSAPVPSPLRFCTDKLKSTGFEFRGVPDREISRTLEFCETFAR